MMEIPVFYASSEGQTARIAGRMADRLRGHGYSSEPVDVASPDAAAIDWDHVRGAVLGASLHGGRHQRAAEEFARSHAVRLNAIPSAFFSVSLGAGSKNPEEVAAAQAITDGFCRQTGLPDVERACMKGRLAYTQYGFFKRMALRAIARREGGSTDTSRDHEYTDWTEVERFADRLAARIRPGTLSASPRATDGEQAWSAHESPRP